MALLYHHARELAGVDKGVADPVHDVGNAADVGEVAVRDEEAPDLSAPLLEVAGVGQDVIDARRLLLAELESAVEDEDVGTDLDGRHVAADLLHAAQGNDADSVCVRFGYPRGRSAAGARVMLHPRAARPPRMRRARTEVAGSAAAGPGRSALPRASGRRGAGAPWSAGIRRMVMLVVHS